MVWASLGVSPRSLLCRATLRLAQRRNAPPSNAPRRLAIARPQRLMGVFPYWSKSMDDTNTDLQRLQSVGINISTMKKGDYYTQAQVVDAFHLLDPSLPEKIVAYERGERGDPRSFAAQQVQERIEKIREELDLEKLVTKAQSSGIRVLTDSEAVPYLNAKANAGLKKHRRNTEQLFSHIDASKLDQKGKHALESSQRRHAFIAAAAQGARTQALHFQRKGLTLPNFSEPQRRILDQIDGISDGKGAL